MNLDPTTRHQIDQLVASNDVVLFMKGTREAPQCGFSATVIGILDGLVPDYTTWNVLSDPAIREGIKEYSSWPTIPQLYVRGEFLGGCDIIQELAASGELAESLGVEPPPDVADPAIAITPAAANALRDAAGTMPEGSELHLSIDVRFQNKLFFSPPAPGEIAVEAGGFTLYIDRLTASRADGVTVDVVESSDGPGFQIVNPNAPGVVQQIDVAELKRRLDAGELREFFDVRTPEERATASIPGSRLVTPEETQRISGLPKNTLLVFHCHTGGRSQSAAEHFAGLGFTNVYNVAGGIDAWSREIDPTVPRY